MRIFTVILLSSVSIPASAAQITVDSGFINIYGELKEPDVDIFKALASPLSGRHVVFLNSPGGHLLTSLQIGEFIRLRGWATAVPGQCYSGCALIWLSGTQRFMSPTSKIGFHAASVDGKELGLGNALVGAYLTKLGLDYKAVAFATSASPDSALYLTPELAKELGIEVNVVEPQNSSPTQTSKPASVEYLPRKDWDSLIPSNGRYIHRFLYVGTDGSYKLIAIDHDQSGSTNGNSVCFFRSDGWSDCITNAGGHYQLKPSSIKSFINTAAQSPPLNPSTEESWSAKYLDYWSSNKPWYQQVRVDMAHLMQSGQVPLLPNGLVDLDTLYNKAVTARYPWVSR